MLQWFFSFPEFVEFTEILFYLGKTQLIADFPSMIVRNPIKIRTILFIAGM